MAKNNDHREPLSFWGTVGANMVGGLLFGGVAVTIQLIAIAAMARRVGELEAAVAPQQLPPNGGG